VNLGSLFHTLSVYRELQKGKSERTGITDVYFWKEDEKYYKYRKKMDRCFASFKNNVQFVNTQKVYKLYILVIKFYDIG